MGGKLGKVINPDPWKAGSSNNTTPGAAGGSRKVGENKLLTSRKNRFNPVDSDFKKCRICKQKEKLLRTGGRVDGDSKVLQEVLADLKIELLVHQVNSHYCQECAYKKGICAMCGHKIIDTSKYRQS